MSFPLMVMSTGSPAVCAIAGKPRAKRSANKVFFMSVFVRFLLISYSIMMRALFRPYYSPGRL